MPIAKQLIARTGSGGTVGGATLWAYEVSFTVAGVPVRGGLVADGFYNANGAPVTQGSNNPSSTLNGRIEFMLEAGVYWLEVRRGPDVFALKTYQVGRASARDVGFQEGQLPDVENTLAALRRAPPTETDDGKVLVYDHGKGSMDFVDMPTGGGGAGLPDPATNEGKVLIVGAGDEPEWVEPSDVPGIDGGPYAIVALTGNPRTLTNIDANRFLEASGGTDVRARCALNSSVGILAGRMFHLTRVGPGELFIDCVSGVTINGVGASDWRITSEYGGATLYKRGTDDWVLQGQIEQVV